MEKRIQGFTTQLEDVLALFINIKQTQRQVSNCSLVSLLLDMGAERRVKLQPGAVLVPDSSVQIDS